MRILVTGGAGYIGSITTRVLLDEGHSVVVLDTLERGWRGAVDPRAEFLQGSVGDPDVLESVLPGCVAVVHAAGYIEVGESQQHPEMYLRNNAVEPLALLEAMASHGVECLVFSSTAAVYGEPEAVPITEDAVLAPINAYGTSKLEFERSIEEAASTGLRAVRFRYFNVAGAHPDGTLGEAHIPETHIIPRVLGACLNRSADFTIFGSDYPTADGTCIRDYIHVMDIARAHLLAVEHLAKGREGGVYNLGNGSGFSNLEVVKACSAVTGVPIDLRWGERRPGDPAVLVASGRKASFDLGWEPQFPGIESMVESAWRWHQARQKSNEG